jgi:hypothetical protein
MAGVCAGEGGKGTQIGSARKGDVLVGPTCGREVWLLGNREPEGRAGGGERALTEPGPVVELTRVLGGKRMEFLLWRIGRHIEFGGRLCDRSGTGRGGALLVDWATGTWGSFRMGVGGKSLIRSTTSRRGGCGVQGMS